MVASMGRMGARRGRSLLVLGALLSWGWRGHRSWRGPWPGPARPDRPAPEPEAGLRVQSVLAQLLLREAGLSSRQDPLVLTAAEVNAFLAEHVEVRDAPVWPVRVQIDPDGVELGGATTLGRLVEASGWDRRLGRFVPGSVWRATRSGSPRAGRIAVSSGGRSGVPGPRPATIGRQAVAVGAALASGGGPSAGPGLARCRGSSSGWTSSPGDSSSTPGAPGRAGPPRARRQRDSAVPAPRPG